jgi:hypothetical protein
MPKIDEHQTGYIIAECQKNLDEDSGPGSLFRFYQKVKGFCLLFQLTLFVAQAQSLARNRWKQVVYVQKDTDLLVVLFWKDFSFSIVRDIGNADFHLLEPKLLMKLQCTKPNDSVGLNSGILAERVVGISELDIEQLLFESTKIISKHIISFWISSLHSSPFQFIALHEASKTIVTTLELCLADSNLQIIFNRRTGSITIHSADSVGVLKESFYIQALQELELELNKTFDLLSVLKKLYLVVC